MERHTEIEHVLRPPVFCGFTQHKFLNPFWYWGTINRSHLQGSRCPRRTCLGCRWPAHAGCLL